MSVVALPVRAGVPVLVLDMKANDVDANLARTVTNIVVAGVSTYKTLDIVTREDLKQMVESGYSLRSSDRYRLWAWLHVRSFDPAQGSIIPAPSSSSVSSSPTRTPAWPTWKGCGGRRKMIAFSGKKSAIKAILEHLGLPSVPLPIGKPRDPPKLFLDT